LVIPNSFKNIKTFLEMKANVNYLFSLFLAILSACGAPDMVAPLPGNDGSPLPVSNAQVENFPGGARIIFSLPVNSNALYVQAVYPVSESLMRERRVSIYSDTLVLDGFVNEGAHQVQLYTVNRNEERSTPTNVTVHPETPPYIRAGQTLQMTPDFGGALLRMENQTRADLAIFVIKRSPRGIWETVHSQYTRADSILFNVRGLPSEEQTLGVVVRDKFQNISDTTFWTGVPVFELEIDRSRFREYRLPNDVVTGFGWIMSRLWDDNVGSGYHTVQPGGVPLWFTFDMQRVASLSRFWILQRGGTWIFNHGNPRLFEVWGTAEAPAGDGSWDGWTKLMDCEITKPSGLPVGSNTADDIASANAGHHFNFPPGTPPVRYIRIRLIRAWGGTFFHAMELRMWGAYTD